MKPSTHSNAALSPGRKLGILLCLLIVMTASVESLTRAMHDRRQITLSIEAGIRQALLIRRDPDRRQILFAGNSLIFDDVSQSHLQQAMGPGFLVHTAGVPGSTYYDWRYGLRALFARGSQPDVLVFSISPSQFLRQPSVTPAPVSLLWTTGEIIDYRREQRPTLTTFSELLLEHYSTYFALRDTVRIYTRKFIPGYEAMTNHWSTSPIGLVEVGPATETIFFDRLSNLAAECGSHTQLVLMIPPTNQANDQALEPALKAAAKNLGIAIIEPIGERDWPPTSFREDGYHLNPAAATEFSKLVAADLKLMLLDTSNHNSGQ